MLVAVAGLSLAAACGQPGVSERRDLLFVQAGGRVVVIAAGEDEAAFEAAGARPSHDRSTVVRAWASRAAPR